MRYLALGLVVESDICLPLTPEVSLAPDVVVQSEMVGEMPSLDSGFVFMCSARYDRANAYANTRDEVCIELPGKMRATMKHDAIAVQYIDWFPVSYIAYLLLHELLVVVLHMRGAGALHGAAVEMGGKSVCLVAYSGAGKSNMSAYLCSKSHGFLSDDVVPIADGLIWGSIPSIKLTSESASRHIPADVEGIFPVPGHEKPWYPVLPWGHFISGRRRLHAIYALMPQTDPLQEVRVTELSQFDAFQTVLNHTCAEYALPRGRYRTLTLMYAALCREVPVRQLFYPKTWEALPLVEEVLLSG